MKTSRVVLLASCGLVWGCGGDEDACDLVAQTGCDDGQVCEVVDGQEEPGCFLPVVLRGDVFDLADSAAVEGAHVVALDPNGAPVSTVATTDAEGAFELSIPATRDSEGVPLGIPTVTLRADAAGYQTFPSGLRRALPIDTASPVAEADALVIESSLSQIGLIGLEAGSGAGAIFGTVENPGDRVGALVVAESGGVGYTGIADLGGSYRIVNLPDGEYEVTAYAQGVNYTPGTATVAGNENELDLALSDQAASTMTGQVSIVNPGDGSATSVVLMVASTFDATLARGEAVPGLRAPEAGAALDVTGAFSIEGVPAGNYVVLAAFEDDFLVRDPDSCIAGTAIVEQEVLAATDVAMEDSFKITGALDVISPGANGAEGVGPTPIFSWKDDSSEDEYRLVVFDSFGQIIWETTVPGSSGEDPAVTYDGPALEAGTFYQFRAVSVRSSGTRTCEISQTEDLKGVFYLASE